MTKEEMLQAIAITSGIAGIDEFNACEAIHKMDRFIEWYKKDISFCTQEGKELGAKVISFLNVKTTISNSKLAEAFNHLTKDDLKRIATEEKINRKRALEIAAVYNLDFEVKFCMDFCGMSPIEALTEWDLL